MSNMYRALIGPHPCLLVDLQEDEGRGTMGCRSVHYATNRNPVPSLTLLPPLGGYTYVGNGNYAQSSVPSGQVPVGYGATA